MPKLSLSGVGVCFAVQPVAAAMSLQGGADQRTRLAAPWGVFAAGVRRRRRHDLDYGERNARGLRRRPGDRRILPHLIERPARVRSIAVGPEQLPFGRS